MKRYLQSILFMAVFSAILIPSYASAGTSPILNKAKTEASNLTEKVDFDIEDSDDLEAVITNIINIILGLLGTIAVILIVYAGGNWLLAAGSEEKIRQSKAIIRSTVIGIVIAGFAYAISTFIINTILGS